MRIAVASDDGVHVAAHTGRCQGFVIFEVGGQQATWLEYRLNKFTAHARGECDGDHARAGAGGHASHGPLVEALADCRALVTRGLGPRLLADLASRGVDTYVCAVDRIDDAADMYSRGALPRAAKTDCCRRHE